MTTHLTNVLACLGEVEKLKMGVMSIPRFADLHTSNKCNQKCVGCAYGGSLDGTIMSEENHFKVIKDLRILGVKAFDFAGGGEPLMLPYINKIWNYLHKVGLAYGVITNGTLLTDELIEQIVDQATYIRFSFETADEEEYCRYKNTSVEMWKRLIDNVQKIVRLRNKKKSTLQIGMKISVGKSLRGKDHVVIARGLASNLGVDSLTFKALRHEPEELTREEKEEEEIIIKRTGEGWVLERFWIIPFDDEKIPQCWLNPLHIVVDYKGNIYLCCYYYYRDENHCLGNMLKMPVKELWYSSQHRKQIAAINKEECRRVDCKFFFHHQVIENGLDRGKVYFL